MKKVVALVLLGLFLAIGVSLNSQAADGDLTDLYPYDQQACLEATNACTQTKVGSSYWTFEYAGYRYHFVKGAARYVSEFNDANADGFISATEMGALSWNAFAGAIFNNTDETVVLSTLNARTDLTSVVHRIYTYWDADGVLQMVENHIHTYYIFNDGTVEAPDWRLATEAEKAAYDAADPKPVTTRVAHVRMKLDAVDSDGYVLEPLGYLKWTNADVDTAVELDVEKWSTIVTGNPNFVTIPADWTVVTFGTFDRGSYTSTQLVTKMANLMVDDTVDPIVFNYAPQPAVFSNELGAMDDDPASAGINVVVEYNGTFDLPNDISVSWVDMFDNDGMIINNTEKLDYEVEISQEGVVLETIDFTYDSNTDSYTPSGAVTVIDSSAFGDGYTAIYRATNPEMQVTEREVDIVIGVMPPKFAGVMNRYVDEDMFVDLMEGITADDGYGNDLTDTIQVTYPAGFNYYFPQPGQYQIDLEFTHHVHFDGVAPEVTMNGTTYAYQAFNPTAVSANDYNLHIYTNVATVKAMTLNWTSAVAVFGADGKLDQVLSRANNKLMNEANPLPTTDAGNTNVVDYAAWQAALTLEEGGFIVVVKGTSSIPENAFVKGLPYDVMGSYVLEVPDFDYDIVKNASYMLTVDDTTAPIALIVDDNYTIKTGEFTNRDQAILANVVVFDYFDSVEDLAVYVSNNGNLNLNAGGTYTVEVTVEDVAGNATVVTFDVHVVLNQQIADLLSQLEDAEQALADLEDQFGDDEAALAAAIARIAALETALAEAQEAIEALQVVPETGCGSAINGSSALFITLSILMGTALIVFIKKRS